MPICGVMSLSAKPALNGLSSAAQAEVATPISTATVSVTPVIFPRLDILHLLVRFHWPIALRRDARLMRGHKAYTIRASGSGLGFRDRLIGRHISRFALFIFHFALGFPEERS